MKGPSPGLWYWTFLCVILLGYIKSESEKDFEFAGEKESFRDDEDYLADQEGSGDIEGSAIVPEVVTPLGKPTGVPGLFRAIINITSLQYTEEIRAAGRDIAGLSITQQIQAALQALLDTLPGQIRIRVVNLQPGSLMVTFDIDTDGQQTEEQILKLLKDALNRGAVGSYRVSQDGFDFRRVRDIYTCAPRVGPVPRSLPSPFPDNYAYLIVNNAFPCNGFVTAWNFQRAFPGETVYIGVFRQTSDTEFVLVDATEIPRLQEKSFKLQRPILVQKGDFIGVFNRETDRGGNIAFATEASVGADIQEYELYQGYRVRMYARDVLSGAPFQISDFDNTETRVMFAVQADMSYVNVPEITTPAPRTCSADEWTCKNGDCIRLIYYCDQQVDCYDGSDEENCPADRLQCSDNEFRCANGQQCIPIQFFCNFIDDCGDNSDEVNCPPGPARIASYRDGSEPDRYTIAWARPQTGTSTITSYTIKYRPVSVRRGQLTSEGDYIFEQSLGSFTEVLVSSAAESYLISNLQPANYYQVEISANNANGASEPQAFIFRTANAGCRPGQWQCSDGGCIDIGAHCDNVPDCADDSDEKECGSSARCLEGLEECLQPDGSIICVDKAVGCAEICAETEFQCLDGHGCIRFSALCDGRIDCLDLSDEANCECAEGEFQCTADRNCISGARRCDSNKDCKDGSDEANCPCPDGFFQCVNTTSQECISNGLKCDGVSDCSDGSDEAKCGCSPGQWQCADKTCIPASMRCDGRPQCEDRSDEISCVVSCRPDQWTCADGNCVEGPMRCDGVPQCEDRSDEDNCRTCRPDQWTCADGNCVEGPMRCDGGFQCEDRSDEDNCTCRAGMFRCRDGNCVEGRMECDGVPQCEDGSDEFNCATPPPSCPSSDFQCATRERLECIDKRLQCDGYEDCMDGSDEKDCPGCKRDEFTCRSDGRCLPAGSRCNTIIECADRSDELGCVCTAEQFKCGDGICIDLSRRCDRRVDCVDQSDELACPCRSGEFQCSNGDCISEAGRCNGRAECRDRSDEEGCPPSRRCQEGNYQCQSGHCLVENRRCDGVPDCPQGDDELECPLRCAPGEIECAVDRKCLRPDQICNRVYDCSDGRDELECARCTSNEFQCESDRSCISRAGRCNGRRECSDGSDEANCPPPPAISLVVSPQNLRIRQGAEAIITCMATGLPPGARLEWFRGTQGLPAQSAVEQGKLMIPVAKEMDSGDYTCRVVGVQGSYQATARLEVVAIGPTPEPPEPGKCGRDEAVCQNGQCIRREYRCDGEPDCEDGSDEPLDCSRTLCEPNEFQCPTGQCVMKIWRCDGENDCEDGFDESNCKEKEPSDPCGRDEFQCVSGNQCVPLAYQCDQEIDCLDRSDEIGCSPPIITVPPVAEIEVELGGMFTIICEAVGVPTPLIVWRLNWGNIPSGDRVTVVSEEGRGVLTVRDARYTDAGAYTCEAINNRGSIFAIPDALVIVRPIWIREPEIHTENIILIGGSDYLDLNVEHRLLTVGVSDQCSSNLHLSMVGSRLYTECLAKKQKVEIAYVGKSTVDIEIVKRVILIEMRGDVLPEPEKDVVVVHIGGLPPEMQQEMKHRQIISGVTATDSMMRKRVIEIGGRGRNKYQTEKQIIHVGVNYDCQGILKLADQIEGRKVLQCITNVTDVVYRTADENIVGGKKEGHVEKAPEIIYVAGRVPQKTRKKLSRVIHENLGNTVRKELVAGSRDQISTEKVVDIVEVKPKEIVNGQEIIEIKEKKIDSVNSPKMERIEITEINQNIKPVPDEEIIEINRTPSIKAQVTLQQNTGITAPVQVSQNINIVETGRSANIYQTSKEIVITGEVPLNQRIVGEIFEISGGGKVETNSEEKYVTIGTGTTCKRLMEVKLIGSALTCNCDGRNITMNYIGQGPTDIDISYRNYYLESDDLLSDTQNDEILMYVGGIPVELKTETDQTYYIKGVSSERDMSQTRQRKEQVIHISGGNRSETTVQRQTLLIGVSRNCEDLLTTRLLSGKTIVECAKIKREMVTEIGQSNDREIQLPTDIIITGDSNQEQVIEIVGHATDKDTRNLEDRINDITTESSTSFERNVNLSPASTPIDVISEFIEERLLMIGGTESVHIDDSSQEVGIGFRGTVCSNAKSYRIMSQDTTLVIDCEQMWSPIDIVYMGQSPTDIYLTKSVVVKSEKPEQKKEVVAYFGGGTKTMVAERKVVEIIRNVNPAHKTGIRKVMTFGGQTSNIENAKVVLEIGFSKECSGLLHKEEVYGRIIISCRKGIGILGKGPTADVSQEIVIAGESPTEKVDLLEKTITIQGKGKDETDQNEFLVLGVSKSELNETSFVEEQRSINKTVVIDVEPVVVEKKRIKQTVTIDIQPIVMEKERVDLAGKKQTVMTETTTTTEVPKPTIGAIAVDTQTQKPKELQVVEKITDKIYLTGEEQIIPDKITPTTDMPSTVLRVGVHEGETESNEIQLKVTEEHVQEHKSTVGGRDKNLSLEKIILVSKAEYVNINQETQSIELGLMDHCAGNFSIISANRNVQVVCRNTSSSIAFQYVGHEEAEFEVKTSAKSKQVNTVDEKKDVVHIKLIGFQENFNQENVHGFNSSDSSQEIIVEGIGETLTGWYINVVEIGIKQTCKSGNLTKYIDESGTLVYCSRRADILPEQNGYGNATDIILENTISEVNLASINRPASDKTAMSGEYAEIKNGKRDGKLIFGVTEEKVVQEADGNGLYKVTNLTRSNTDRYELVGIEDSDDVSTHRRGDITIEEAYGDDLSDLFQSDRTEVPHDFRRLSNLNVEQKQMINLDIDSDRSVDIDLGDNCKGKIEAIESEDGVIVRCSIGGESFQINLVGFGRIDAHKRFDAYLEQNDEARSSRTRFLNGKGNLITEREIVVPGKGIIAGKDHTIHEVYYASEMIHVDIPEWQRRKKRSPIAEEVSQQWRNTHGFQSDNQAKVNERKDVVEKVDVTNTETVAQPEMFINGLQNDMSINGFNRYYSSFLNGKTQTLVKNHHNRLNKHDTDYRDGRNVPTANTNNKRRHAVHHVKRRALDYNIGPNAVSSTQKELPSDLYFVPSGQEEKPQDLQFSSSGYLLNSKNSANTFDLASSSDNSHDKNIKTNWNRQLAQTDNEYKRRISYDQYKKQQMFEQRSLSAQNDERRRPGNVVLQTNGVQDGKHSDLSVGGLHLGRDFVLGTAGRRQGPADPDMEVTSEVLLGHGDITKGQRGPCSPPFFNSVATRSDECVRCFCFGQTVQCFSSDLQVSRIALVNPLQFTRRESDEELVPVDQTFVNYRPTTAEYQVRDLARALPQGRYYWQLQREFLGDRLTSYGGEIKYTITYEIQGRPQQVSDADVIMRGNGISLYYRGRTVPSPNVPTSISVPLVEGAWEKDDGSARRGDTPVDSQYASREDFMMVLQNVEHILIRGTYDRVQTSSRIGGVFMTTAVDYPTEFGQAYLVEECTCPTGYTGHSCQNCAPGFTRVRTGGYLGQCVSCNCNGHSNDCDHATGQCLNCLHNTEGPQCQLCAAGFYGDARGGTPQDCLPCPCPLTDRLNQFSRTCFLDTDKDVTCANCPAGYEGRRCERCANGYVGDPMIPGSSCTKVPVDDYCDPRGSLNTRPNPLTRRCDCRENVYGERCDTCKSNTFYLSSNYELGCVRCFCMGVSSSCQSTTWNRAQVGVSFTRDDAGVKLADMNGNVLQDARLTPDINNRELIYRTRDVNEDTLYWSLPANFLGDKITAYGGSLRFTIRYSSRQGQAISQAEPIVKLSGNDITLVHRSRQNFQPNRPQAVSIMMYEQNWVRVDGQPATREHLLMALADLDSILIRATFEKPQVDTGLRDVTLDIAESRQTRQDRAYAVESCQCPVGYRGLSCEDCDTGYTRSGGGLYLGLCEPCRCNGHSSECDPETGVCRNCQHNTEGDSCEKCAVGYYGDATRGRSDDCQKCPCPLTEAPNQFSPTCILDRDGQVTCTACPAGHTGRKCETCITGYSGNPLKVGDYCKVGPVVDCDCDTRGIVPNTQCDETSLQCQCKPYVQGRRCARCREGHFYLEANNPQGCLTCFCSGITNQCTSSNYYRDALRPQLGSDGTHNFVLMNRRMNNIVSDGFVVDAVRNQVTYNRFEGVQQERESLFFQLPAKFRGDRVTSYGGYLRFTLEFTARPEGRMYRDVDLEIISAGQSLRLYYLFEPTLQEGRSQTYEILLRESSFSDLRSNTAPTRETFMTILSNIEGILIRATYHQNMASVTLRDVSMDTAVATPTNLGGAPMVEDCRCPEGYTGLSCQRCAQGYLRVSDGRGGVGRCVRCNCNGHATSCDPESGRCLECQDNTEGDRCERCKAGFYGDATSGTRNDCRPCPCPLTVAPNQFSPTCLLAEDNQVTCDRCPTGYTGRQCQICAEGYTGEPTQPGGSCTRSDIDKRPQVVVSPVRVEEPEGSTAVFQCQVSGEPPFNVVWSRLDRRPLPDRATVSPQFSLTLRNLERDDTGRYICTATNRYGVTRKETELKVIFGQTPIQVRIDKTRLEIEEGRTARFVCTATGSSREMTYILSWSKQGGQMPSRAIDQNGVLVIPNIQRSDAGNYVCMGSDMNHMDEAVAVLIVSAPSQTAPEVRIEPRYQEVQEGTPIRFTCIATGNPTPRVEWYRGGNREMNPAATITSDGVFRIPSVRQDDESDYYCKATNDLGSREVRTILYVKRATLPEITIIVRQTKYVTLVGETARLECYVEQPSGKVTLFWSRTTGLPPGSNQDNGILTIPNVQPSYAGNYVCTGTETDTGRVSTAVAVLEVTVKPDSEAPTVRLEPERITIPMGSTGTLRCEVTGKPEPTITWIKSREELASNHQVSGNILRITQATMADRGIYVCRAENAAGLDQDWTIVEVERRMRPKIDLYPNSTQRVAVGGSALFQCRVMDGDPPPTITWSRVGGLPMPADRIDTMENGVIMFKQVTQAEQGGYICTAENEMGTTTATASLLVRGPPTITLQPSQTVYALIGERVTLECTADGDPIPQVYWIEPSKPRRGDVVPDEVFYTPSAGSAIVDIASFAKEDEGYYTCVASNTGGSTQDRVHLLAKEGVPRGVSISGPSTLSVVEGQSVELICSANELSNPVIRWRRREGILPPGHSVREGVLTLPRFRSEYAGEYICSTTVQQQSYEASVFIIVTVAPRLTISPQRITSRAGDRIQLRCTATGSGPFNIEWSRVDAQMNPSATERDGILEIPQVTAADAGRYRCVVQSSSGSNDGYAIVEVNVPPAIAVAQRDVYTEENRIAELRCDVTGSPPPVVRWEKESGQLPAQHRIQDGVLTIYGVQDEDAGRYICTASSSAGTARDYAVLHVNTGSTIDRNGGNVDTQIVNVGDSVTMECIVTGTPLPTITWSRDDGPLPRDAVLGDGVLIIPQAKIEDAGTYTCLAVNEAGSISSKVVLYVRAQPLVSAPSASTAALGDRATLVCDASGYPSPDITWYRKDGKGMPSDYTIVDGDLVISRVRQEDAGTYVCTAQNEYGKTDIPVSLNVGALVPHFSQNPRSYIAYEPLNDVYLDFDILLSLRPESTEGMVLYNGQYEDGGGDFVCFGLHEGYPEFRFDVGSGPAIIRGNNTLGLNEWHTVKLTRNRNKGSMVVNEGPAYTGESPGYFTGLDLGGKMYIGSVPEFNNIPRVAGFREGFVGSVSEVKLKGIDLNLGADALEIVGVEPYNACRNQPCANGGSCVPANVRNGYRCMCTQGYTGTRCQETGERCYQGACGPQGRCYNLEGRSGFRCICPLGKTGAGCQADVTIINPFFNRTSFISFPPSEDTLFAVTIKLEFKPQSLSDGIILYEGNSQDGSGDFMAVIQKDGYLEFRFDTGSGPAIIRSRNPLRINEWTRVTITRKNRDGTLVVNNEEPVTGSSTGSTVGLNLKLPLYLGGPDPTHTVSPSTGAIRGFIGCVAELTVNDRKIDLLKDALESANIVDCGERRLCERQPCKNNAVCEDLPGPDYRCLCEASHTGKNCEIEINICLTNSPCKNNAPCSITDDGYRCDCPLGFAGVNCEQRITLKQQFGFDGDGFLELTKDLLPHAKSQERQTISFNIRTTQSDGLVLWQGEVGGRPLRGGDHISIGLKGGYLEFSYEMGSGPAMIMSRKRVDDGKTHAVALERLGRSGSLTVDNADTVYGDSQGYLQMLNADGNIYIGGVSIIEAMTDGKFKNNFIGCIDNIKIHGKGPLESRDAVDGYNVLACSP